MFSEIVEFFSDNFSIFDICVTLIFTYCIIQCFNKGFSLSLISFMKWIISTIVTIILVPKLQPVVSDYIESEFVNNIGLGITIFILTLFLTILIGKTISKTVTWTGVGSVDKTFGVLSAFLKVTSFGVYIFNIKLVLSL